MEGERPEQIESVDERQFVEHRDQVFEQDLELNRIYNESNLDTMARMPDNFIDLTVTSPPYDNLRDFLFYGGFFIIFTVC